MNARTELLVELLEAAGAIDAALRPPLAAEGLGNGDFDVLAALRRAGAPYALRHRDLTTAMLVTPGAVTKRVDRLAIETRLLQPLTDREREQLARLLAKLAAPLS